MKKILITFILGLGLLPCFSSAGLSNPVLLQTYTTTQNGQHYTNANYELLCIKNITCVTDQIFFNWSDSSRDAFKTVVVNQDGQSDLVCGINNTINFTTTSSCKFEIYGVQVVEYSSLQCQTEYNLIPISSVDQSYCESNNLCPTQGSCTNGVSNVFINDIFHPGAFNVIINIPDEIDWDYAYTNSGSNINIDVVGYNQDTEYINAWIDTNNYKPTTDDFSNTFLLFKDYSGLLVALLFVILVFYFVKKLI